jgi:hypothetical protein
MLDHFLLIDNHAYKKLKQRALIFVSSITDRQVMQLIGFLGKKLHKTLKLCFFHEKQTEDEITWCRLIARYLFQRHDVIKSLCY